MPKPSPIKLPKQIWVEIGESLQVDWDFIKPDQWIEGCLHEWKEHFLTVRGDLEMAASIALDHLKEDPDYYFKLQRMEAD